jgi:HSF-type DNA-binding protein
MTSSFLENTFDLVDGPGKDLCWSDDGRSIVVDAKRLAFHVDNTSSWTRQLNMYGFSKVKRDDNMWEFRGPAAFRRGASRSAIRRIRRKTPASSRVTKRNDPALVRKMKESIEAMMERMDALEAENGELRGCVSSIVGENARYRKLLALLITGMIFLCVVRVCLW